MKVFQFLVSSLLMGLMVSCGSYENSDTNDISSRDLNHTLISKHNYFQSFGKNNISNKTFYTAKEGENSVKIAGGTFNGSHINISKSTDTNASLFITSNSLVDINTSFVKTDANKADAIAISNGELNISNSTIECNESLSNGFFVSGKSLIKGVDLKATIMGTYSSMIVYGKGKSTVKINGGSLTLTDDSNPFIRVLENTKATTILDGVNTTIPSGILMKIDYKNRSKKDDTTGVLILSGSGTTYTGSVIAQKYSTVKVTVNESVAWQGAYDAKNIAKSTSLTINGGTWILSGDSNVDSITLKNGAVINKAGYSLTYTNLTNTSGTISD